MGFDSLLAQYIDKYECSTKELSSASGLSSSVISRYKSGEREPGIESEQLLSLAEGLANIASSKGFDDSKEMILSAFIDSISQKAVDYESFSQNFGMLINVLQINIKKLSQATNFDTSYLYRVRSGQRRPHDLDAFLDSFCSYVTSEHNSTSDLAVVSELLKCNSSELQNQSDYLSKLKSWLHNSSSEETTIHVQNFLKKLSDFDLNEYIKDIHFDTLKVPTSPIHLPTSKNYYGIEQMKKAELIFFKETVLSKSQGDIFMCSDMPMEDMSKDIDFGKKWMFAIAASLKKGLHLNIIHNIDRPFTEMMLGLESWIPIYMTGQISPYYFPNIKTNVYHHINYVSGVIALSGECINGSHANGKYYLTNNKEEVNYYQEKARLLLKKASPLMTIFREDTQSQFVDYEKQEAKINGKRKNTLSTLPIYTLSKDLLTRILKRANVSSVEGKAVTDYWKVKCETTLEVLESNEIIDEIPVLSKENFDKAPLTLWLSGSFIEKEICYTYEEYLEHLSLTRTYETGHNNYRLNEVEESSFKNIQIQIIDNKSVIISKEKAPVIHFAIKHPKLVTAITNYTPLIKEDK